MRSPREHVSDDGTRTYRVRFRAGGKETSETFRAKSDAQTFATILDGGGVTDAMRWLAARENRTTETTFGQWFEEYVNQLTGVTSRTRADYRSQHRRYLTTLDGLPLPLITRSHVTGLVNRLDADGLSPKTIKNVIHMLASSLALAVDEGQIPRNPCARVRLPKARLDVVEAHFLTTAEAGALIRAMPERWQPFTTFLFGTGLRWSEATALKVRDVDFEAGTLRVDRAWKRIAGGQELGPPKSLKARRTINPAVAALVAAREAGGAPNDFLWRSTRGGVIHHGNYYNRVWVPACEAAGLTDPRPRIHDTRHSHASWLLSDGQALEAVQDQLGHESYETTRKVYAHLLPAVGVAVGRAASAAMEEVLAQSVERGPAAIGKGVVAD